MLHRESFKERKSVSVSGGNNQLPKQHLRVFGCSQPWIKGLSSPPSCPNVPQSGKAEEPGHVTEMNSSALEHSVTSREFMMAEGAGTAAVSEQGQEHTIWAVHGPALLPETLPEQKCHASRLRCLYLKSYKFIIYQNIINIDIKSQQ